MATPPTDSVVRVLLVDDDHDDFVLTRDLLDDIPGHPFQLEWLPDFDSALLAVERDEYDAYLFDYHLGQNTGLELLTRVRAINPSAPVIMLTGLGEWETDLAAMQAGAADYLEKGKIDAILLERSIRYAMLRRRYEADLEHKVQERTHELERTNAALQKEVGERKRAEDALRLAHQRKDEFLATLAHELRNPLAPIRNALEIMRLAGDRPDALAQARQIMERQVAQMARLIDDLLDVSRIASGKLRLMRERVDVREVVEAALESSQPLIEKAGLSLVLILPPEPIHLAADRVRVAQVLSNLLNNAAKYTEPGGTVTLAVERDDSHAVIHIRDTGIGIPPDVLPHVFNLFTQVDRSLNRSQGGLGIGLALVRSIVEMHHGSVSAHSDGTGHGAEFVVRMPLP